MLVIVVGRVVVGIRRQIESLLHGSIIRCHKCTGYGIVTLPSRLSPPHHRFVSDMSRFMNSRGFPCLFPPFFDPPLANHARHPTRNAPVAAMATMTKGFGGIWPFPTPRITRPRGMPVAHPFAAAAAAGPTFVPCASANVRESEG